MFSQDQALINNSLPISVDFEDSGDQLVPTISLIYKRIANSVNGKESALYSLQEKGSFQQYFISTNPQQFRNVYRKCFDMVNLNSGVNIPAAGTVTFPTNIVGSLQSALIYANATNVNGRAFSFVYPNVYIDQDATPPTVTVVNPDAANALTQCDVIANYLKN
jgi:hypothetical protein